MISKRLYLRAFEKEDFIFINKIRNSPDFFEYSCGNKFFTSSERDKKWIEDKITNNHSQLYLVICEIGGIIPIGYISANNIDYINRKAQWGGIVIDSNYCGKGYGTESALIFINHIFNELNMNLFYGYWREDHDVSIKMALKIGFINNGILPDFVFKQGKYYSAYLMTLLKKDFYLNE